MQRRRVFAGSTGWTLTYSDEEKTWTVVNKRLPDMDLSLVRNSFFDNVMVPTGKYVWNVAKNPCNNWEDSNVTLQFSACNIDQFTCDDGKCIPMQSRCNNLLDCKDVSDENNCHLVKLIGTYMKDKTPPSLNLYQFEKFPVNVSVKVYKIIRIYEGAEIINIQFQLGLTWLDSRHEYYNLKENR